MKIITQVRTFLNVYLLTLVNFFFVVNFISAQMPVGRDTLYGNEWIDYSQTYFKIPVAKDGIYRITTAQLQTAGVPLTNVKGNQFQLFRYGQEIKIFTTTDNNFSANDFIEFYGQKARAELDSFMFKNGVADMLNPDSNLFSDTATYFLTWKNTISNKRISSINNNLTNLPAKENFFRYDAKQVFSDANIKPTNFDQVYVPSFGSGEGFGTSFTTDRTISFTLTNFVSGQPARVQINYAGSSSYQHFTSLTLNNNFLLKDTSIEGEVRKKTFNIDAASVLPTMAVRLISSGPTGDYNSVGQATLNYAHTFNFEGQNYFEFNIPASNIVKYLEIDNFNAGTANPILYDVTNGTRMTANLDAGKIKIALPSSVVDRQLVLVGASNSLSANAPVSVTFTDLKKDAGDYIIFSSDRLIKSGTIQDYANYRNTSAGGAFKSVIVDVRQLYDQFGYGSVRHIMSIRNYIHYIKKNWSNPRFIVLIGKGRDYTAVRSTDQLAQTPAFDVPTWGYPGSDILFGASNTTVEPVIPIGRISAIQPVDVSNYLEKVKAHENAQNNAPQTAEARDWMKNIITLSSGGDISSAIKEYTGGFSRQLSNSTWGANVTTFYKYSDDPVYDAKTDEVYNAINKGASLINFFGHSATGTLDFDVDNPTYLTNTGKYPVLVAFGCAAGNLFQRLGGVSENMLFYKNKGMLAFIGTTGTSYVSGLTSLGNILYKNIGTDNYTKSIGEQIKATAKSIDKLNSTNDIGLQSAIQELTLNGDPAVKINYNPKPDFLVDPSSVKIAPSVLNAQLDSFKINFDVLNLGAVVNDTLTVTIKQQLPNGTVMNLPTLKIPSPAYRYPASIIVPMPKNDVVGLNKLLITVNANKKIIEGPSPAADINNDLTLTTGDIGLPFYVLDNKTKPVFPSNYSIVNTVPIVLKASTSNPLAVAQNYVFEIDTTENFSSTLKQRTVINQKGGVLKWQPNVAWRDSTVYYWRVSVDSTSPQLTFVWENSSFVYLPNAKSDGWNQSHYYQFVKGNFSTLTLPSDSRKFIFDKTDIPIQIKDNFAVPIRHPNIIVNGSDLGSNWGYINAAFYVVVFDSIDPTYPLVNYGKGNPTDFVKYPGLVNYGSPNPQNYNLRTFRFDMTDTSSIVGRKGFIDFLNKVAPANDHILIFSCLGSDTSNLHPELWAADSIYFGTNVFQCLENKGARLIRQLVNKGVAAPYMYAYNNSTKKPYKEHLWNFYSDGMQEDFNLQATGNKGKLTSPPLGPSKSWQSLELKYNFTAHPEADTVSFDVIGLDMNKTIETPLIKTIKTNTVDLSGIDAVKYPYLKLVFNTRDSFYRVSPQLVSWRIYAKGLPDFAVNPSTSYNFYKDTIQQGDTLRWSVAVENVTNIDAADSIGVNITLTDASNSKRVVKQKYVPLTKGNTFTVNFKSDTKTLSGKQQMALEVNPTPSQPELYSFNNFIQTTSFVDKDKRNPLLDVTFDGLRILNNDIVSPKPLVKIDLKDENKFYLLNDTSLFRLYIVSPSGTKVQLSLIDPSIRFIPAVAGSKENKASIEWKPTFTVDGTYKLIVQARDVSGNASGATDYSINFNVISKSQISNVLNYPNPFSNATRFVFTLTGTDAPARFKIQIMTVSGKVVREITQDELGALHIGTHMTDYVWNGTDEFGSPLANGVYLYRVIAKKSDGTDFEKYDAGTDAYFKKGIGKLVIVR